MKKMNFLVHFLVAILFSISGCSSAEVKEGIVDINSPADSSKILIVYLSRTSNTKTVAEIIQSNMGGTLVALELEKPYPENYRAIVEQVVKENETGYLPPLKTKIDNIESFDIVFVGFPTWGMKLPPPMKSFLTAYNLSGKTVVPFHTNGGYGIGSTFETVTSLCRNAKVLEGFTTKGGVERDGVLLAIKEERRKQVEQEVKQWLTKIGLVKNSRD
jgi:flavodoxin